jgi:hypothetical protein
MLGRQLDLFSAAGVPVADDATATPESPRLAPSALDDVALAATLATARLADCRALCAEVGRRRLTTAIPALEGLCRRFKGFGLEHAVPEQIAALNALTAFSTPEAAAAVSRIIADGVVQGPDCAMPSMPPSSSDAACLPRSRPPFYDITTRRFGLPPVVQSDLIPKSCHCWSICWMTSMDPLRLPQVAHWAALEGLR